MERDGPFLREKQMFVTRGDRGSYGAGCPENRFPDYSARVEKMNRYSTLTRDSTFRERGSFRHRAHVPL